MAIAKQSRKRKWWGFGREAGVPEAIVIEYRSNGTAREPRHPLRAPKVRLSYEPGGEWLVHAEVPGAQADRSYVLLDASTCLIAASPVRERSKHRAAKSGATETEGTWYAHFQIPCTQDPQRATATLSHGVLAIRFPARIS